jgi:hypothetical protein
MQTELLYVNLIGGRDGCETGRASDDQNRLIAAL